MNELSLFSGAGGGLLATHHLLGWRAVGYVEHEPYCQRVLAARITDCLLDPAPIFGDVRDFLSSGAAECYRGVADVVTGGFPCQPFSVAGKRAGADDARNMWPETAAVLRAVRPRYCLLENVAALLTSGYFDTVLGDLAAMGFDARWGVLGADDAGAPHRRKRLWIVADADGRGCDRRGEPKPRGVEGARRDQPDGCGARRAGRATWWDRDPADAEAESRVGRVVDGVPHRVDRLRALGNGQVPSVAALAWELLS